MIQGISTISFGQSTTKTGKSKSQHKAHNGVAGGAIAGTGAVTVAVTGNKVFRTFTVLTGKTKKIVSKGSERFSHFKSTAVEFAKTLKSNKVLAPLAKLAEHKSVGIIGGAIASLSALFVVGEDINLMFDAGSDLFSKSKRVSKSK